MGSLQVIIPSFSIPSFSRKKKVVPSKPDKVVLDKCVCHIEMEGISRLAELEIIKMLYLE